MKYKSKPKIVEAIQYTGTNAEEVRAFAGDCISVLTSGFVAPTGYLVVRVDALNVDFTATAGDYIVRKIDDDSFFPCRADVFEIDFEPADE